MNRLLLLAWLVPTSAEAPSFEAREGEHEEQPVAPRWVLHRATSGGGTCDDRCPGSLGGRGRAAITFRHGGSWELAERVSAADIRRVIANHRHLIRYCYEQALVTRPELAGRVAVRFVIGESGAVTESTITESEVDGDVADCVAGRVALMPFPSPGPGAMLVVSYPFVFRAAP